MLAFWNHTVIDRFVGIAGHVWYSSRTQFCFLGHMYDSFKCTRWHCFDKIRSSSLAPEPGPQISYSTPESIGVDSYLHAHTSPAQHFPPSTYSSSQLRNKISIKLHTSIAQVRGSVALHLQVCRDTRSVSTGLSVCLSARNGCGNFLDVFKSGSPSPKPCTASRLSLSGTEPFALRPPFSSSASRSFSSPSVAAAGLDPSPCPSCFSAPSSLAGSVARVLLPPATIPPEKHG